MAAAVERLAVEREGEEALAVAVEVGRLFEQRSSGDHAVEAAAAAARASSTRLTANSSSGVATSSASQLPPAEPVMIGQGRRRRASACRSRSRTAAIEERRRRPAAISDQPGLAQRVEQGVDQAAAAEVADDLEAHRVAEEGERLIFGDQHGERAAADEEGEVEMEERAVRPAAGAAAAPAGRAGRRAAPGRAAAPATKAPISSGVSSACDWPKPPPNSAYLRSASSSSAIRVTRMMPGRVNRAAPAQLRRSFAGVPARQRARPTSARSIEERV